MWERKRIDANFVWIGINFCWGVYNFNRSLFVRDIFCEDHERILLQNRALFIFVNTSAIFCCFDVTKILKLTEIPSVNKLLIFIGDML